MFYQRIAELRVGNDKSQQEIADILHCDWKVYSRYEKGERTIPIWVLVKLAAYYGVSVDYIIDFTDEPKPHKRSGE